MNKNPSKKLLITGAAGFIGFHLAKELKRRGDEVIGVDNFNPYYSPQLKRERALSLQKEGIEVIEGDMTDLSLMNRLLDSGETTHLIHLAAQAGVRYSLNNPQAYVKANLEGFVSILEACRAHPHVKLIYASSSSVYGLNDKIPFSIEDKTDRQTSLYGATKKANELMAHTYHHLFGLSVTGLRFFTVYGPWGRPDMAYYSFAEKIVRGEPIEIYNHGKMERDFTYIDDIVKGMIASIDLGAPCEVFNLGNNRPEPLHALIESLENHLGLKAHKKFVGMQQGDVLTTYADIDYSRQKLGFMPKISLHEGIGKFVTWYKEYKRQ